MYVYKEASGGSPAIRLVQFTSDGHSFTAHGVVNGPENMGFGNPQVVIADFNGDG